MNCTTAELFTMSDKPLLLAVATYTFTYFGRLLTIISKRPKQCYSVAIDFASHPCKERDAVQARSIHLHLIREHPLAGMLFVCSNADEAGLIFLFRCCRYRACADHFKSFARIFLIIYGNEMLAIVGDTDVDTAGVEHPCAITRHEVEADGAETPHLAQVDGDVKGSFGRVTTLHEALPSAISIGPSAAHSIGQRAVSLSHIRW